MTSAAWLSVVLLAAAPRAGAAESGSHAPAESLTRQPAAAVDVRRETLSEMWQRGIVSADMSQWSPEDMALLKANPHDFPGLLKLI